MFSVQFLCPGDVFRGYVLPAENERFGTKARCTTNAKNASGVQRSPYAAAPGDHLRYNDPASPWVLPCMQRGMLSSANKQEDVNGDVPPASLYNFYCMALRYYLTLLKRFPGGWAAGI